MKSMVEIYNYDISTHERYALEKQGIEAFQKQYHLPPSGAGIVAVQTKVLDFVPKHPAIDLLLQSYQRKNWARFVIPQNYYLQRFASSYVAPSLGSAERQDADVHKLETYLKRKTRGRFDRKKKDQEEEKGQKNQDEDEMIEEGTTLINLLESGIKETNEMIDYIFSRIYEFVQA